MPSRHRLVIRRRLWPAIAVVVAGVGLVLPDGVGAGRQQAPPFDPLLAGGIWWLTASPRCIGPQYCSRWWENAVMAVLFVLALYGAYSSVQSIVQFFKAA